LGASVAERSGALWEKQLLANLIDLLMPNRLVEVNAAPGVELVTNWQGEQLIVNLINYHAAVPGHYGLGADRIVKATDITLRVSEARFGQAARVLMQPGNRELPWTRKDGWLEIKVPDFLIHTFVVLQKS
jgi:hypothetical protein